MVLLCGLTLLVGALQYLAIAQVGVSSIPKDMSVYSDTTYGFSFYIPKWFSVRKNVNHRDIMVVMESNEVSFRFETIDISVHNDVYEQYVRPAAQDSNDLFLQTVKEATFFSGAVNYQGLVQYARLDSLKKFKSTTGLRVFATYRTVVSIDGIPVDNEHLGPLYFIDISELSKGKLLKLDFSWYDITNVTYRELALSIALSVRPK
jgi:hypothetical protein